MNKFYQSPGIAIVGTRERGGITAVIENHIQSGVYKDYDRFLIASNDEASIVKRVIMAVTSLFKITRLIIQGKVSICHLHGSYKGSIYRKSAFLFVCRLLGCKVIFHLHGSEFAKIYENSGSLYKYLVRYVLDNANCVFVLSSYWKSYIKTLSHNPEIRIINNFPSPVFEKLYEDRNFSTNATTELLFLGKIGQRKGIYDLVDAVDILKSRGVKGFRITVGGNGEIDKLKTLISKKGLGNFFNVIGWVSGNQKHDLIKGSDLLLLPSHNEGLPIAILEALSAGLAVLSTNVGGIPDAITDDRYGLLVEPGQPKDLANAISRYLNTEGLVESVARNARKLYDSNYSSKINVEQIRSALKHLVYT